MLVLAFDPGETTGFAVVGDDGLAVLSGGFPQEDTQFWVNFLAMNYEVTHLVVEPSPQFTVKTDRAWNDVLEALQKAFFGYKITAISPGIWKPMKEVLSLPNDSFGTQHEKDAVMIARWFLRNEKSKRL